MSKELGYHPTRAICVKNGCSKSFHMEKDKLGSINLPIQLIMMDGWSPYWLLKVY